MDKIKNNKEYIFILLLFITPILVSIANILNIPNAIIWFVPNFIAFMISIKLILLNIKSKTKEHRLIGILIILSIISCLLAYNKEQAFLGSEYRLEGFLTYLSYLGFFYIGTKLKESNKLTKTLKVFVSVTTLISLLCLLKIDIIYDLFGLSKTDYYFYVGPFAHFNHFGYYLLIANICSIFLFLNEKNKILYFVINTILLFTLVINDTFGVFLAYIFMLILLFIYYLIKKENLKKLILILILFIIICCTAQRDGFNVVYRNISGMIKDTNQIINSDNKEDIYKVGTSRGQLWINGFEIIKQKPLFGCGFENTKYEYIKREVPQSKPHNLILEQALNYGIPATIIYFILLAKVIIKRTKTLNNIKPLYLMSLLIVISYITSSMFGNSTFYVSPYFYIFLGLIAQNYYNGEKIEV